MDTFVCSVHGFYKKPLRTQHKDVALHPSQASGLVMCSALTRGQEARTLRAIFPFYESGVSKAEKCSLHTLPSSPLLSWMAPDTPCRKQAPDGKTFRTKPTLETSPLLRRSPPLT